MLLPLLVATTLAVGPAPVLEPPVEGPVVAAFDAPTRYGPGHRGVDLAAPVGTPVRAPAGGRITFAGVVVGHRWVTVDHGALRSTVGPLDTASVRLGDRVERGSVLGRSGLAHGRPGVHWSVRRGDTYLDPLGARPRVATLLPPHGRPDSPARWEGHRWRPARVR